MSSLLRLVLATVTLVAACGGDEPHPVSSPPPGAAPAAAGAPTKPAAVGVPAPKAASAVKVVGVDIGAAIAADKTIATPTTTFAPTDTIYVIVRTEGAADFASLAVHWKDPTQSVTLVAQQSLHPIGPASTEFHYGNPRGLPKGTWTADVILDGTPVESRKFVVQ
jgi:hypothetical protein